MVNEYRTATNWTYSDLQMHSMLSNSRDYDKALARMCMDTGLEQPSLMSCFLTTGVARIWM